MTEKYYAPIARANHPSGAGGQVYYRGLRFTVWFNDDDNRGWQYLRRHKALNELLDMFTDPDRNIGFAITLVELQDDHLVVHQDGTDEVLIFKLEKKDG